MTNEILPLNDRDETLWAIAKKRVAFKKSFLTYSIINTFLWSIWFFRGRIFGNGNYNFSAINNNKVAVIPPSKRFLYIGCFLSFGIDRTQDAINNNL